MTSEDFVRTTWIENQDQLTELLKGIEDLFNTHQVKRSVGLIALTIAKLETGIMWLKEAPGSEEDVMEILNEINYAAARAVGADHMKGGSNNVQIH